MPIKLDKVSYTADEVTQMLQEEGDKTRKSVERKYNNDYVSKDEYEAINKKYTELDNKIKVEKFNENFNKKATELKVKSDYINDVKLLAGIKNDDTDDVVLEKITKFKVSKPIFFEHTAIDTSIVNVQGIKTNQDKDDGFIPGTLVRKKKI